MPDETKSQSSVGVLAGVQDIIDQQLGLHRHEPRSRLSSRASCRALSGKPPAGFLPERLINDGLEAIIANRASLLKPRQPSRQNWRFEKKLEIAAHNKSPEKTLEKAIARVAGDDWVNQVPTASGLANATNDRHRNVDLVHRISPHAFEFIELKMESDTPLYAAFEALVYGVLYMYARLSPAPDMKEASPILSATHVHLKVLAPLAYYSGCDFGWLQAALNEGLGKVTAHRFHGKLQMDFAFTAFQQDFIWPCPDEALITGVSKRTPVTWQS